MYGLILPAKPCVKMNILAQKCHTLLTVRLHQIDETMGSPNFTFVKHNIIYTDAYIPMQTTNIQYHHVYSNIHT